MLDAGPHVLSEVIAATSLEECWALVEAVERSGRTYMLAENYCYMRPNMLVRQLADAGRFGAVYYAEGAYLHDCRHLGYTLDGAPTWRGELSRSAPGNVYPTHSLGPVAQWLGTAGLAAADRLVEVTCLTTPNLARRRYAVERFGAGHPTAAAGFFTKGDSATTVLVSERGSVAHIRVDANSPPAAQHDPLRPAGHGGGLPLRPARRRGPADLARRALAWVSPGDAAWAAAVGLRRRVRAPPLAGPRGGLPARRGTAAATSSSCATSPRPSAAGRRRRSTSTMR